MLLDKEAVRWDTMLVAGSSIACTNCSSLHKLTAYSYQTAVVKDSFQLLQQKSTTVLQGHNTTRHHKANSQLGL